MKGFLTKTIVGCLLLLPLSASGEVKISEVMYDLEGSDAGREWVEIVNEGVGTVDVSGFKLFEANTNHGLTLVSGNGSLPAGSFAVIADDPEKFKADHPSFSGTLFDSSFSLSNTGESLGIRTSDLSDEDTVTYSSDMGGAGDGLSLSRSGSSFLATASTPGTSNGSQSAPPSENQTTSTTTSSSTLVTPSGEPTKMKVYAGEDRTVSVGAGSYFEGHATGFDGKPLPNARFVWNFGDGVTVEGKNVFHAYAYPGNYVLFLSASSGDHSATARLLIEAIPAQVALRTETDGSISVFNRGAGELDLSSWFIARGGMSFLIPRNTLILPKGGLRFGAQILRLPPASSATLLYPNGTYAAASEPPSGEDLIAEGKIERIEDDTAPAPRAKVSPAEPAAPSETQIDETTLAASALVPLSTITAALGGTEDKREKKEDSILPWLLGLITLTGLGAFGVWAILKREEKGEDEASQYEIIEEKTDPR